MMGGGEGRNNVNVKMRISYFKLHAQILLCLTVISKRRRKFIQFYFMTSDICYGL